MLVFKHVVSIGNDLLDDLVVVVDACADYFEVLTMTGNQLSMTLGQLGIILLGKSHPTLSIHSAHH